MPYSINPSSTVGLHDRLAAALPSCRDRFAAALQAANENMRSRRMTLGGQKPLEVALSALLLEQTDVAQLRELSERLHSLIEHVVEMLLADRDQLRRFFPDLQRIFPYLAKTRGAETWQVLTRYDAAVTPDGGLKIMELNTACPGAFLISEAVSRVTREGFQSIGSVAVDPDTTEIATVQQNSVADGLLHVEKRSGIEPGAIGILNDENELAFELDHLAASLRERGRNAIVADARQLQLRGDRLYYGDDYLSVVFNKFRISTPNSPNHCWRPGFESRYAAFLDAQRQGQVVSVNNLVGITVAENKSLLALLHDPEVLNNLTNHEQRIVRQHVLWTARLADARADFHGQPIDLLPYVKANRERFVIKPANEGRGFGVVVGKYCTADQWNAALQVREDLPQVVQEYAETLAFPVVCDRGGTVTARSMFLTLGLATICGRYQGLVSRVSASPITNVAREGFGQAVFVSTNSRPVG
jgi:hypothetical protein